MLLLEDQDIIMTDILITIAITVAMKDMIVIVMKELNMINTTIQQLVIIK